MRWSKCTSYVLFLLLLPMFNLPVCSVYCSWLLVFFIGILIIDLFLSLSLHDRYYDNPSDRALRGDKDWSLVTAFTSHPLRLPLLSRNAHWIGKRKLYRTGHHHGSASIGGRFSLNIPIYHSASFLLSSLLSFGGLRVLVVSFDYFVLVVHGNVVFLDWSVSPLIVCASSVFFCWLVTHNCSCILETTASYY